MNAYLRPVVLLLTAVLYIFWNALEGPGLTRHWVGCSCWVWQRSVFHMAPDVWTHEARSPGRNATTSWATRLHRCHSPRLAYVSHAGLIGFLGLSAWHWPIGLHPVGHHPRSFYLGSDRAGHHLGLAFGRGLAHVEQMGVTESAQLNVSELETTFQLASTAGLIACTIAALRLRNWDWL